MYEKQTKKCKFGMLPLKNTRNISLECKNMSSNKNLSHFSQIVNIRPVVYH